MLLGVVFILAVLAVAIMDMANYEREELHKWNYGICRECGTKWERVNKCSNGDRVFVCQCERSHVFITSRDIEYLK